MLCSEPNVFFLPLPQIAPESNTNQTSFIRPFLKLRRNETRLQAHAAKTKLPVIEKKNGILEHPEKHSPWSFASKSFHSPRTAFGSASKAQRSPSMHFKRIIPDYVYKSRHATKEQIAIQARLRRSLSRQKIRKFKRKLKRVFEEKASLV